jgi:hypothetical protein
MSKVMKILLSASIIVLIMALWVGCSNSSGSSTPGSNQPASSSAQNKPDSTGQQANPSGGQQQGNRPMGGDNSQMNQVAVRAAEILGVSEDEFVAAFQTAVSNHMPKGPGEGGQQPPQSEPPESMGEPPEQPEGEPPEMQPGQQGGQGPAFEMEEIYEEMAEILGLSADDIASAFQQAQQELSQ